jgi:hypothetical protein
MRHILVETNWVVDWAAPAHHRKQSAVDLFDAAVAGRCWLHIPAISLAEARPVIRKRFKLSDEIDGLALFSRQLLDEGAFTRDDHQHAHRFLNLYEDRVRRSFEDLEARLDQLRRTHQVEVFALSEAMLERSIALSNQHGIELEPFDNSILAAIIERATALAAEGATDLVFATKDAHLLPRFRNGKLKEALDALYRGVGLEVVDGFGKALGPLPAI